MTHEHSTATLARLICEKARVLERLRDLSREQQTIVAGGEMSALMTLLSRKQRLLASLQEVERWLNPYRDEDPERRDWSSQEARAACQREAERCEALLGEILLNEKHAEAELRRRRDDAASRLDTAQSASAAIRAYGSSPPSRATHLDLHDESSDRSSPPQGA